MDSVTRTDPVQAVPGARAAARKVKSWLESDCRKIGDFTGLPKAIYQNWLMSRTSVAPTDGRLASSGGRDSDAKSDYPRRHLYVASSRRITSRRRDQADAPPSPASAEIGSFSGSVATCSAGSSVVFPGSLSTGLRWPRPASFSPEGKRPGCRWEVHRYLREVLNMDYFGPSDAKTNSRLRDMTTTHAGRQCDHSRLYVRGHIYRRTSCSSAGIPARAEWRRPRCGRSTGPQASRTTGAGASGETA